MQISPQQIEQGLRHLAGSNEVTRANIVEGIAGLVHARQPLDIAQVRPALERAELTAEDLGRISQTFFDAAARFLFPGVPQSPQHYAHSFLQVALMAKAFEQQTPATDLASSSLAVSATGWQSEPPFL